MNPIAVAVRVEVDVNGKTTPQRVTLPDGQSYAVERVLHARPVKSSKKGGNGFQYLVRISGQTVSLIDAGIWTLEWDE